MSAPGTPEPLPCGWRPKRVTEADVVRVIAVEAFRDARREHVATCTQDRWPVGNGDCCVAAGLAAVFAAGFRDGLADYREAS